MPLVRSVPLTEQYSTEPSDPGEQTGDLRYHGNGAPNGRAGITIAMSTAFEYIIAGALVAVVLFVTYRVSNRISQNRVTQDFRSPEDILTAVDVYVRYGQERAARKLLDHGLERYPDHAALKARRQEMTSEA